MGHYKNFFSIKTIDDIKAIFPDGEADELNWCLFSTGGIHGGYDTLDDIMGDLNSDEEYEMKPQISVLVIRPRMVSMMYGYIEVVKEDIPYLRKLAKSSLEFIKVSQKGNL